MSNSEQQRLREWVQNAVAKRREAEHKNIPATETRLDTPKNYKIVIRNGKQHVQHADGSELTHYEFSKLIKSLNHSRADIELYKPENNKLGKETIIGDYTWINIGKSGNETVFLYTNDSVDLGRGGNYTTEIKYEQAISASRGLSGGYNLRVSLLDDEALNLIRGLSSEIYDKLRFEKEKPYWIQDRVNSPSKRRAAYFGNLQELWTDESVHVSDTCRSRPVGRLFLAG